MPITSNQLELLAQALRERLKIIADHKLRDHDANAHLLQLQIVSEKIEQLIELLPRNELDPRFRHYLTQRSYNKAFMWIESQLEQ